MESSKVIAVRGVEEIGEKKLVGFRVVCEDITGYGNEIPKAASVLDRRRGEIMQLKEPVKLIGAFKAADTSSSDEDDGYWVCFEVVNFGRIPEGMVPLTVPAQKYAVLQFKGHASEIYGVYQHLHKWMNENGYRSLPGKWTLEIYSKWTEAEDIVELCCPVEGGEVLGG